MLACIAAHFGTDSETVIQAAISAMMLSVCAEDRILSCVVSRAGGVNWAELEAAQLAKLRTAAQCGTFDPE
jgi:hypothetical protein